MKLSDHEFSVLAEPGSFKGMMGPAKTETKKKIKPNAIWMQNIDDEGFYDLLIKRLKKFS